MESRICVLLALISVAHCTIYFKETFDSNSRWVPSLHKGNDAGEMKLSSGKFYGDKEKDQGLQTSQDAKFYQMSAKLDEPFSNEGKDLILQFSVKHEQNIDCGGGYIKLFPSTLELDKMNGDSPYHIMFGPDICGPGTKKVHNILTYKGKNHLIKKDIRCKDDEMTHLYTLILKPDNTYEVRIDGEKVESGSLEEDWDLLPPKKMKDPAASKPDDWVDNAKMDDPEDTKPDDWEQPELIADEGASKPQDWDDEEDGEWEAPMINNPDYKGEWKPKQIDNPAYKGEWVHPEIDNPDYSPDDALYKFDDIGAIGFEIWQVKSGTIFDNIIVTDSIAEAEAFQKETFDVTKPAEKEMKDKLDEEERKKREEEDKLKKDDDDEKDEEVEDDDEVDADNQVEGEDDGTDDSTEEGTERPNDEL